MRRRAFLSVLLAWLLAALSPLSAGGPADGPFYRVLRVVDGDTVVLEQIGKVRLIGVDTPETVDPRRPVQRYGREASDYLKARLLGESVRVEYDQQRTDKYGRTLAYLYLSNGVLVNLDIIEKGYGHAYVRFPFQKMAEFRAAERGAREGQRGLWSAASTPAPTTTPSARPSSAGADGTVWVNTASGVYHCPGARNYGSTKAGVFMRESEARARGHRPAGGRACP